MRTPPASGLHLAHHSDCVVAAFPDEVDLSNAPLLRTELLTLLNGGVPALIMDLSGTAFCDSAAVDAIARIRIRASALGVALWLVLAEQGTARKVCEITGMTSVIPVATELAEARAAIRAEAATPSPPG